MPPARVVVPNRVSKFLLVRLETAIAAPVRPCQVNRKKKSSNKKRTSYRRQVNTDSDRSEYSSSDDEPLSRSRPKDYSDYSDSESGAHSTNNYYGDSSASSSEEIREYQRKTGRCGTVAKTIVSDSKPARPTIVGQHKARSEADRLRERVRNDPASSDLDTGNLSTIPRLIKLVKYYRTPQLVKGRHWRLSREDKWVIAHPDRWFRPRKPVKDRYSRHFRKELTIVKFLSSVEVLCCNSNKDYRGARWLLNRVLPWLWVCLSRSGDRERVDAIASELLRLMDAYRRDSVRFGKGGLVIENTFYYKYTRFYYDCNRTSNKAYKPSDEDAATSIEAL